MALNTGDRLGPYEILTLLGVGGMGVRLRRGFGGFLVRPSAEWP